MGRKSVLENQLVSDIQSEILDHKTAVQNLESQFQKAKNVSEKAHRARLAYKIRQAVDAGVSDYAIGVATGKTSHRGRVALVEWAMKYDPREEGGE